MRVKRQQLASNVRSWASCFGLLLAGSIGGLDCTYARGQALVFYAYPGIFSGQQIMLSAQPGDIRCRRASFFNRVIELAFQPLLVVCNGIVFSLHPRDMPCSRASILDCLVQLGF